MVGSMEDRMEARLRRASFTYDEVGATAWTVLPTGYGHLERWRNLLDTEFESAAARLMAWRIHEAAGLRVSASDQRVAPDAVVEMSLGPRWMGVRAMCRVAYVINEPDRIGFAYGTLPGHAERGEESFILDRRDGSPRFTVRAFSEPASRLARVAGPIASVAQLVMAERYLRAAIAEPTFRRDVAID